MWRPEGGRSHKSTVFDGDVIGCVCRPHGSPVSRVFHTTKRTHTCFISCPWTPGRTRCDPSLTGPGLLFSTLKGFKNTCFSHIQLHPRTPHSSPCIQILCVPHRSFIRGTISERITVRSMNDLCCVFQSRQRARLCSG